MLTLQDSLQLHDAIHRTPGPIDHALAKERIEQIMTGSFAIMVVDSLEAYGKWRELRAKMRSPHEPTAG